MRASASARQAAPDLGRVAREVPLDNRQVEACQDRRARLALEQERERLADEPIRVAEARVREQRCQERTRAGTPTS